MGVQLRRKQVERAFRTLMADARSERVERAGERNGQDRGEDQQRQPRNRGQREDGEAHTTILPIQRELCLRNLVAGTGACAHVGLIDPHEDASKRAVPPRVIGGVAQRVLVGELLRDEAVDAGQLRDVTREERPRAGLLRERFHRELGLGKILLARQSTLEE